MEAEAAVEEVEGGEEEGVGKAWENGVDVAVDIKIPLSVAMQLVRKPECSKPLLS